MQQVTTMAARRVRPGRPAAKTVGAGALLLGLLVGCGARPGPLDPWAQADQESWQISEGGSRHLAGTLSVEPPAEPAIDDASSVEDYVRVALERNPRLASARQRVEAMQARIPQATSLDDPMLQVAPFGEMAETASGEVGLMTGLSQKLPFPGKLDTRGRIAFQGVQMAVADLREAELEVVADTRRAFWSYYFTVRAIETTEASRELMAQLRQIAEAQYRAGARSQADVLRAGVELGQLDSELVTLAQRRATAEAMLNQLLDRSAGAELPEPEVVEPEQVAAALEELLDVAALANPALDRVRDRIEQSRQRYELAKLSRWPDLTVSANYNVVEDEGLSMAANGEDQWWLGFGVNLPIWTEKYEAAEREALAGVLEGAADLTSARNRVAFQVQEAYLEVEAQRDLVELFGDVIIPQAEQAVEASASGYRAGEVDFLTLVDNWRKRLSFDLMYHRALAEMEQAVADLERAVGENVSRQEQNQNPSDREAATPPSAPQAGGEE
ncbi:MAG: TolC family protein [Phycisphaeraceae bacterium]